MKTIARQHTLKHLSIFLATVLSVALSWFAVHQYRLSAALAEENLRGLALSLSAAVEAITSREATFASLRDFQTDDLAYLALIDRDGRIRFHGNSALTGERIADRRCARVFENGEFSAGRVLLGTGELIYESNSPVHVLGKTFALRLALHTYRADSVVRKARIGVGVLFALIAAAWVMAFFLNRFAQREMMHKKEMAHRQEMARLGEMGAVIAHEIRNPLAGIKGYAQLLQEKQDGEEDGLFTELIVSEAIRLEEIVNGLLSYTQAEPAAPIPVDIHDALTRALAVIAPEAASAGVGIECALKDSLRTHGSLDRLEQLFLNLFKNALQAMPHGGTLRVSGQRKGKTIELSVADTGQGIGREDLERIFEPFFTTRVRGTGLGLAVCKRIIEEQGGSIVTESTPGRGTTFVITIPGL